MQEKDFDAAAIDESDDTIVAAAGNGGTVPAAVSVDARFVNPFVLFRQRNSTGGAFFHGPVAKCDHRSGEWMRVRGESETAIDPGERFKVNPPEMIDTWTKFVDGKRVDGKVYRTADGEFAPAREELGDLGEHKWTAAGGNARTHGSAPSTCR
jgi:hypothetical protein